MALITKHLDHNDLVDWLSRCLKNKNYCSVQQKKRWQGCTIENNSMGASSQLQTECMWRINLKMRNNPNKKTLEKNKETEANCNRAPKMAETKLCKSNFSPATTNRITTAKVTPMKARRTRTPPKNYIRAITQFISSGCRKFLTKERKVHLVKFMKDYEIGGRGSKRRHTHALCWNVCSKTPRAKRMCSINIVDQLFIFCPNICSQLLA